MVEIPTIINSGKNKQIKKKIFQLLSASVTDKEVNGFVLVLCTISLTWKNYLLEPENLDCSEAEIYF